MAELFLLGASAIDLGYDVLPIQLSFDALEIRKAQQLVQSGKLGGVSAKSSPSAQ